MNKYIRTVLLVIIDIIIVNLALYVALWLRFDGRAMADAYIANALELVPVATVIYIVSFYLFRLYNRLWQYASIGELLSIVMATAVGSMAAVSFAYFRMAGGTFPLPRTVFVLWSLLIVALIGFSRLSWRIFRDNRLPNLYSNGGRVVLIAGAGDAGVMVAREYHNYNIDNGSGNGHEVRLIGFVDDDPGKQGTRLLGLPVLGTREDIPRLVKEYDVAEIVIAMPSVKGRIVREIVGICRGTSAKLRILPGIYDILEGRIKVDLIRRVQVEDILGREPAEIDLDSIAGYLLGKVILVTGAGGSIGSELCRQVTAFEPEKLILLDHEENNVYEIHRELNSFIDDSRLVQAVVDVQDETAVDQIFRRYRPEVVFHAAAHKHVPLMEFNPAEAIKNNVLGTRILARAADKYGSGAFIFISTDKAVNPTSIMGASKRVAEMVVQEMAWQSKTRFAAVRFGNVLGSKGSVVPLFQRQIAAGGPVTVTHPEMTRYFMTIPEAVQLVIQAGALARGGEIFLLDMGEPVRILDLARNMIYLSGFVPGEDIEIIYSGIRPGEKLYEELLTISEGVNATVHERIFIARPEQFDAVKLEQVLQLVSQPGWHADMAGVEDILRQILPDFRTQKGKSLVQVG